MHSEGFSRFKYMLHCQGKAIHQKQRNDTSLTKVGCTFHINVAIYMSDLYYSTEKDIQRSLKTSKLLTYYM